MSNYTKKPEEIKIMAQAGKILGEVLHGTLKMIRPGITEIELDYYAEGQILGKGGYPGFKKVDGYKNTICVATNDVVVHGIPGKRVLKDGDIIAVDCGVYLDGYHSDMAETVLVGKTRDREIYKFLEAGKNAMYAGIKAAKPGNHVGHISKAMQEVIEGGGYNVVKALVGHGVGKNLHEDPQIPGYLDQPIEKTPKLEVGMTIAIEIIYNMGKQDVEYEGSDDWTIVSVDGSLSGVFERTLVITADGPQLLTAFPQETIPA